MPNESAVCEYSEDDIEWKALVMTNRLVNQVDVGRSTLCGWIEKLLREDPWLRRMDIVPLRKALVPIVNARLDKAFDLTAPAKTENRVGLRVAGGPLRQAH